MGYTDGMPSRNRIKQWAAEQTYHVYNRGNNKQLIFADAADYAVFLNLLKRSLQKKQTADRLGRPYRNWYGDVELMAFCLMPNHFHLLMYQQSEEGVSKLMSSVITSYAGYFNKKHGRVGRLFQDTFKATHIDDDAYWQHISRYIHLNPKDWKGWRWSSLAYFTGAKHADWVLPGRVLAAFDGDDYESFVADYEGAKSMEDELKYLVAG